jgi:hypothetical protein
MADSDDEDAVTYGDGGAFEPSFLQDTTIVKPDWQTSFDNIAGYRNLKEKVSLSKHIGYPTQEYIFLFNT